MLEEKHKFDCFFGNSSSSKLLSFRCLKKLLLSNNSDDGCWLRIFVFSRQNISCAKDNCFSSSSSTSTSSSIFIFHFFGKLEVCLKKKEKQRKYEIITYQFYRSTDLRYTSHQREISIWLLCLVTYVSKCNILKHFYWTSHHFYNNNGLHCKTYIIPSDYFLI